ASLAWARSECHSGALAAVHRRNRGYGPDGGRVGRSEHAIPQVQIKQARGRYALICLLWSTAALAADRYTGSASCAGCHPELFRRYSQTAMGRSSGPVSGLAGAEPAVSTRGLYYRIASDYSLEISKRWAMEFFIGSGSAARSFLWSKDGFLFQSPVTWY